MSVKSDERDERQSKSTPKWEKSEN